MNGKEARDMERETPDKRPKLDGDGKRAFVELMVLDMPRDARRKLRERRSEE